MKYEIIWVGICLSSSMELYFRMSQFEKLKERFLSKPKDFTYNELKRLLNGFGYEENQMEGSMVLFYNAEIDSSIRTHKPHGNKSLKGYQMDDAKDELIKRGLL